ncbi:MAG: single-stranded DNA-binding protein [Opitutales bacterium]|nr:single-stranded DNA-binding protein [Opitutales bacterium]
MNAIHLSGRIATDPEIREFENSTLCRFSLAVSGPGLSAKSSNGQDREERTDFFSVEFWNPGGVADILEKGAPVLVSGFLKQDQWTTEEGEKRSRVVVSARLVELLESKAAADLRRQNAAAPARNGGRGRQARASQSRRRQPAAARR